MKTTKLISALLLPSLLVACSDDVFESNGIGGGIENAQLYDVTLYTGINGGADTKGAFAGGDKGVFDNFYFEPDWTGASNALVKTDNSAIKGDQVGLCLPNPLNNGNVQTNVPFYIAGYEAAPKADGSASLPFSLDADDPFYALGEANKMQNGDAFADYTAYTTAVGNLKIGTAVAAGAVDITKGVFRSISGVMGGNYVLYYPYNDKFQKMEKIPAVTLPIFNTQTTLDVEASATTNHVMGENLFAYSKTPFVVDGVNVAQKMDMAPAAYFFQFKIYTSGNALTGTGDIKMITVSTADNAKAFAINGTVSAGATNKFTADATTAVDMIGLDFTTSKTVASVPGNITNDNKNEDAYSAYLSTYPVASALQDKDIVIKVYTKADKVYTVTKAGAGSRIVEGGTDYWNIDLNGVQPTDAERLVYNETTLTAELAKQEGTLILKNNIELTSDLTIGKKFTIKGADYTITNPAGGTLTFSADCDLQCKVVNKGTISLGSPTKTAPRSVKVTTIDNEGAITVPVNGTLTVATLNNKAVPTTGTAATVEVKYSTNLNNNSNGKLVATTLNNEAAVYQGIQMVKYAGVLTFNGTVENSTINNDGTLSFVTNASAAKNVVANTVTINNKGEMTVGLTGGTATFDATLVNDANVTMDGVVVANAAKITNNKNIINNGIFTLQGSTTFTNNGYVDDLGTFSGLSKLTNGANAEIIRSVSGIENFNAALTENKLTGIRVLTAVDGAPTTDKEGLVISTDKDIYLKANLTLDVKKQSTIGELIFEDNSEVIGYVKTKAVTVNKGVEARIGKGSNVYVEGNVTADEGASLTANADSNTSCAAKSGSVSGPVYAR